MPFSFVRSTRHAALSDTAGATPSQSSINLTDSTRYAIGPQLPTLVNDDQLEKPSRWLPRKDCLGEENKRVGDRENTGPPANYVFQSLILVFPGSSVRQHSSAGRPENVFYVFCSMIEQLQQQLLTVWLFFEVTILWHSDNMNVRPGIGNASAICLGGLVHVSNIELLVPDQDLYSIKILFRS